MTGRIVRVALAVGMVLAAVVLVRAQVLRPGDTIQLWEYHTEIVRSAASPPPTDRGGSRRPSTGSPDSMLNSLGRDGWELVGITRREVRVDDTLETETLYIFKRSNESRNR